MHPCKIFLFGRNLSSATDDSQPIAGHKPATLAADQASVGIINSIDCYTAHLRTTYLSPNLSIHQCDAL